MSNCKPIVPDTLAGTTLCITGFSGYVGSHLLKTLRDADLRPFLIQRPNVAPLDIKGADFAQQWHTADDLAAQLAKLPNPVILNIAGHFVSRHMATDIVPLVSGNLEFPLMIFESLRLLGCGRIVNVGTSWEFTDSGVEKPANLYAQLKASNAQSLEWYARDTPLRGINLKLNDTYGGQDTRSKLLPLLKKSWQSEQSAQLRSRAQHINLLHITDVQEGLLAAAVYTAVMTPHSVETAFLIAEETVKMGQLTDRLQDGIAPGLRVTYVDMAETNDALRGVWTAAPRLPNWTSRVSLTEGMREYFGRDT